MPEIGAGVFVRRMIDGAVRSERRADLRVHRAFVGHESAGLMDLLLNDRSERFGGNRRHMERAHVAVALDKRKHRLLRRGLTVRAVLGFAAYIGLIGLHDFVSPPSGGNSGEAFSDSRMR